MIRVQLPDGSFIKVNTDDPKKAAAAARKFAGLEVDTTSDVLKSFGSGVAQAGVGIATLPSQINTGLTSLAGFIAKKLGADEAQTDAVVREAIENFPGLSQETATQAVESVTGELHDPQTTAGEFAKTMGEFTPGALLPGGMMARFAQVVLPALGSETAGQLTKGTNIEGAARLGGAVLGGLAPTAVGRAITPLPTAPARTQAVQALRNEGVESISVGQATGNKSLKAFETQKGGAAAQALNEAQAEEFTAAILRRVGSDARRATPEVMDDIFNQVGREFDDLAAGNAVDVTPAVKSRMASIMDEYTQATPEAGRVPLVSDIGKAFRDAGQNARLSGERYQSLRTRLDRAARSKAGKDDDAAQALRDMRTVLDDAMEQSIARNNPDALGRWQDVRRRYRNLLVVEKAAAGAGEKAAAGLITPQRLRLGIQSVEKTRGRVRGRSEFDELQRAGEQVLTPLPDSGTATNIRVGNFGLESGSGAAGAVVGGALAGPVGAGVGALAGAALPGMLARTLVSRLGVRTIANQAAPQIGRRPGMRALGAAALETQNQEVRASR